MPYDRKLCRIAAVLCLLPSASALAQAVSACDLNRDGVVNAFDIELAARMALGLVPCDADVVAPGVCDSLLIQRIAFASLTGKCEIGVSVRHRVNLNWIASASADLTGYRVYRATQPGGPYAKLTHAIVMGTSYTDFTVRGGQTYYYVTTAVDKNGNESAYSNQAEAVVPAS